MTQQEGMKKINRASGTGDANQRGLCELAPMPGSATIAIDETILYAAMHSAALKDMESDTAPYGHCDLVGLWLSQEDMTHIVRSTVRELHIKKRTLSK